MFDVVRSPIDVPAMEAAVRDGECGGMVTFTGMVREQAENGRAVDGLAYEAYEPMVLEELSAIAGEARATWGALRIAIVHRVGELHVGEIAVAVVVAAPHRAEAFAACAYVVDELKKRAQIWKKERYRDGTPDRWRHNEDRTSP